MDIGEFKAEVAKCLGELFGKVEYEEGVYRTVTDEMGLTGNCAVIECIYENGLREEAPYPVMHFHVTVTDKIPARVVPYLRTGLDELNNAITLGAFPALGYFGFYEPFGQVYLTYRMPYSVDALEEELYNVKYFLGTLYEELDVFIDFIAFLVSRPGEMSLKKYMEYLDEVSDSAADEFTEMDVQEVKEELEDLKKAADSLRETLNQY